MKASEAVQTATKVVELLFPFCERVWIAGSLRRREEEVGDVDIVAIPRDKEGLQKVIEKNFSVLTNGGKSKRLLLDGVQVDLYLTEPEDFEAVLMHRTGSIKHNIGIAQKAKSMGMHLNITKGLCRGKEVIANTEIGIFEALGLKYKEPEERR